MQRLGIDSSPVISFVEQEPKYFDVCVDIRRRVEVGRFEMFTSTVTLAETLNKPIAANNLMLIAAYKELLKEQAGISTRAIEADVAERAAQLRATYGLKTPDAFQIAMALTTGCNAFLTGDKRLKRVKEIPVIVLDDLTL